MGEPVSDALWCRLHLRRYGIVLDLAAIEGSIEDYRETLARVHEALGFDHIHIAREAWETRNAPEAEPQVLAARKKRYWAGGHEWRNGPQLTRFLDYHEWQRGHSRNDSKPESRRTLKMFWEVKVGDAFAIKSNTPKGLVVHARGLVGAINHEAFTLKLDPFEQTKLPVENPPGLNSDVWGHQLLEVTDSRDIALIFGEQEAEAAPQVT